MLTVEAVDHYNAEGLLPIPTSNNSWSLIKKECFDNLLNNAVLAFASHNTVFEDPEFPIILIKEKGERYTEAHILLTDTTLSLTVYMIPPRGRSTELAYLSYNFTTRTYTSMTNSHLVKPYMDQMILVHNLTT